MQTNKSLRSGRKPLIKIKPITLKISSLDGNEIKGVSLNDNTYQTLTPGMYRVSAPGMGSGITGIYPVLNHRSADEQKRIFQQAVNVLGSVAQSAKWMEELSEFDIPTSPSTRALSREIEQSTAVKFCLIDCIMESKLATTLSLKEVIQNEMVKISFANILIAFGAHYKHLIFSATIDLEIMKKYHRIFAEAIFEKYEGLAYLNTLFMGNASQQAWEKFKFAIQQGADVNEQDVDCGTCVHQMLANEQSITQAVAILEECKAPFNYAARDGSGKTPLLIACLTKNNAAIAELTALAKQGKDIGMDVADHLGRTPLMVSAALGNDTAITMLVELKAKRDAVDKQGKGLAWYSHAAKEDVAKQLQSIHIEPDRDASENVGHSWLYYNDQYASPLTYTESKEQHQRVLIAKSELLDRVIVDARKQDRELAEYISSQCKNLCGISIVDKSCADQETVRKQLGYVATTPTADMKHISVDIPVGELSQEGMRLFREDNFTDAAKFFSKAIAVMVCTVGEIPNDARQKLTLANLHQTVAGMYLRMEEKAAPQQALQSLVAAQTLLDQCQDAKLEQEVLQLSVKVHTKFATGYRKIQQETLAKQADDRRKIAEATLAMKYPAKKFDQPKVITGAVNASPGSDNATGAIAKNRPSS